MSIELGGLRRVSLYIEPDYDWATHGRQTTVRIEVRTDLHTTNVRETLPAESFHSQLRGLLERLERAVLADGGGAD